MTNISATAPVSPKLTAIWRVRDPVEKEYIEAMFDAYIHTHLMDERSDIVLDDALVIDSYLHAKRRSSYLPFKGKRAYLIHLSDETYEGGYELYDCFKGVFRNYWSSAFASSRILTIPLGYSSGFVQAGFPFRAASQRPLVWSFMGAGSKASRPDMLRALKSVTPNFRFLTDTKTGPQVISSAAERIYDSSQYRQCVFDSAFIPCPMGNVNLECFRIYEALEAGSIPILERRAGFDYFSHLFGRHPVPTVRKWSEAASLISQTASDANEIDRLQQQCVLWWANFKAELQIRIGRFIAEESELPSDKAATRATKLPFWRELELMRHHSGPALLRRAGRQFSRIVRERKYRLTHGR